MDEVEKQQACLASLARVTEGDLMEWRRRRERDGTGAVTLRPDAVRKRKLGER